METRERALIPAVRAAPRYGDSLAVGGELARALGAGILLPWRLCAESRRTARLREELRADLAAPATIDVPSAVRAADLPARSLRVFVASAEPSGEIHAASFVRALRARLDGLGAPPPRILGTGSERSAAEGVELVGNPVARAAMGFDGVLPAIPYYLGLLRDVRSALRSFAPDVVVPVDSPALHVPLARLARALALPVVHFVAPQLWGWASWRVAAYRRAVDLALTILPFEKEWFARRGVRVAHVGHPLLDALAGVPPTRPSADARALALLPGSREGVVARNLPWMLSTVVAARERGGMFTVRILAANESLAHAAQATVRAAGAPDGISVVHGDLHGELARARAAFSVSGTVLVDVLHHRLPTVVVYRLAKRRDEFLRDRLLTAPWFASPNLVAAREICPEFAFAGDGPRDAVVAALLRAMTDGAWREQAIAGMDDAARRLGPPGAAERAAAFALARVAGERDNPAFAAR